MTAWITIALRNLIKNWRRSLVTIIAIMLGFAAVNLFAGLTAYMYRANREASIYAGYQGHISIFRRGLFEIGHGSPLQRLMTLEEIQNIEEICKSIPQIVLVTPQLRLSGLITNGKVSTIFQAYCFDPKIQSIFIEKASLQLVEPYDGRPLETGHKEGIGVSRGIARFLDLQQNSEAVVMATTAEGQMNALDVVVFHLFDARSMSMDDRLIRMPIEYGRLLYDTDGCHIMSVLLNDTKDTETVREKIRTEIARKGMTLDIKTWNELSPWYTKIKQMFDVIFLFLFTIVFIIVTMSVINTMSMAVLERIREIGTLRALGLKRRGVMLLFGIESCLIGIGGIIAGVALSAMGWGLVQIIRPTWSPPGLSVSIPLQVEFSVNFGLGSSLFLIFLCLIASYIPARRAAFQNVVEALGHV